MKFNSIFYAATALILAACSNESDTEADVLVALTVNANIEGQVTSRATATAFEQGDAIGISVANTSETATTGINVKYVTTDGSKFDVPSGVTPIYFKDGKVVKFTAYYPYSESTTAPTLNPSTSNQTNQADFDFLYGEGSGNLADSAKGDIEMTFTHVMTKVTFTLAAGTGIDGETALKSGLTATYKVSGLQQEGSFDTAKGEAAASGSAVNDWTIALPTTDGTVSSLTSSLLLYPQTPKSLTVVLTYNNVGYTATIAIPEKGFEAGTNYAYTLTLNQTGLTVDKSSITGWNTLVQDDVDAGYEYDGDVLDLGYGLGYGDEEDLKFKGDATNE